MLVREDFDDDSFTAMFARELIDQLEAIESMAAFNEDGAWIGGDAKVLIEAYHRVIAYNSVPGTYLDGKYDAQRL